MAFLKNKWVIALAVMIAGVVIEARTGWFSRQWAMLTNKGGV
jgi:hypothetical protein